MSKNELCREKITRTVTINGDLKDNYMDHFLSIQRSFSIITVNKPRFILIVFKRCGLFIFDRSAKLFEILDVWIFDTCRDTHDLRVTIDIVY